MKRRKVGRVGGVPYFFVRLNHHEAKCRGEGRAHWRALDLGKNSAAKGKRLHLEG